MRVLASFGRGPGPDAFVSDSVLAALIAIDTSLVVNIVSFVGTDLSVALLASVVASVLSVYFSIRYLSLKVATESAIRTIEEAAAVARASRGLLATLSAVERLEIRNERLSKVGRLERTLWCSFVLTTAAAVCLLAWANLSREASRANEDAKARTRLEHQLDRLERRILTLTTPPKPGGPPPDPRR